MRSNIITSIIRGAAVTMAGLLFIAGSPEQAFAKKTTASNAINLVPTIDHVGIDGGQLVAYGSVSATINGKTTVDKFQTPITVLPGGTCDVLNLRIGAIDLNLLGLVVQTSDICLDITATQGGGLLGNLFCGLANLNLGTVTGTQLRDLTTLLNDVLSQAFGGATVNSAAQPTSGPGCSVLDLTLGPVNLSLLGLNVTLDNCNGGPVTVTITAVPGTNNLLGNLLCNLLGSGGITLPLSLSDLLNQLLAAL